jgi:hypothetical protein
MSTKGLKGICKSAGGGNCAWLAAQKNGRPKQSAARGDAFADLSLEEILLALLG